jgi:uncharacterized protein (TIGR03437 family)
MGASNCLYPRDFPLIAGVGANTIWTRERVSPADRVFRRSLESAGLYWIASFSIAPYVTTENSLADAVVRSQILDEFSAYVAGWADEPRLLAVSFGDDAARAYVLERGGEPQDFYTLLHEAATRLHGEHPGLLLTTSVSDVREIGALDRSSHDTLQPELDFWSLDLAGRIALTPDLEDFAARTAKPVLLSGFGIDAYDELAGAADVETQGLYGGLLADELVALTRAGFYRLMGGIYTEFADQWHRGGPDPDVHGADGKAAESPDGVWNAAWGGLFGLARTGAPGLDSLRERPVYQRLAQSWGGLPPAELSLGARPEIGTQSVRNAASGLPLLAPGALLEVAGKTLTASVRQTATPSDLPFHLGATSVCVDGSASPLYFAEPEIVRGLTPWSVRTGAVQAIIYRAGVATTPAMVEVREAAPGILPNGVFRPGLPCPVNEANGAPPGAYMEVYGTGLGPGTAPQQNGVGPIAAVESAVRPSARLGIYEIPVVYSGLFPGAPGVYQTNVRIPLESGPGPVDLRLGQAGALSNPYRLRIVGEQDEPGLALRAPEVEEVVLQEGGPSQTVYLDVEGLNGFCSLVRFDVTGLPPGVRASIPVGLPGQRVPFTVWAEPGATPIDGATVTVAASSTLQDRPARGIRVTVLPGSGDIRLRVVSGGWLSGAPEAAFMLEDHVLYRVHGGGPGRGFNFLSIDPQTGVVGAVRQFDTWESDDAVAALESYLRGLPEGTVVLGAIADDGTLKITEQTRSLMRERLGSALIELVQYQWSWAIIARVGAARPVAEEMMQNGKVELDRVLSFPLP